MNTKKRKTKNGPNNNDKIVGARLREYRNLRGFSQTALADKVGMTFQQIQKYEHGLNRISVSMMFDLCDVLNISINEFCGRNDGREEFSKPEIRLIGRYRLLNENQRKAFDRVFLTITGGV